MFLQLLGDTITQSLNYVNGVENYSANTSFREIMVVIILPFILLLAFTIVKYAVGVKILDFDKFGFFAELPIDMFSIFMSFIIGRYIHLTSSPIVLIIAFILILSMAFLLIPLCMLRQMVLSCFETQEVKTMKACTCIFFEYSIAVLFIFLFVFFL